MFSDVVAIGNSSFRTDAYAAEMDGIPTALGLAPKSETTG
jgi:hypothetical protein